MDTMIIGIYCLCDDLLRRRGHRDDKQSRVSEAEIMTIGLVASYFFGGNYTLARWMWYEHNYIGYNLSKGCFSKRLHRVGERFMTLFGKLGECAKQSQTSDTYVLDSFPVAVCDNIRISRSHLYQGEILSWLYCQQTAVFLWATPACADHH